MLEQNSLVWFCCIFYCLTAFLLLPNNIEVNSSSLDVTEAKIWQFTSLFILRIVLIIPIVVLLRYSL